MTNDLCERLTAIVGSGAADLLKIRMTRHPDRAGLASGRPNRSSDTSSTPR